jgi:hypothetical protein
MIFRREPFMILFKEFVVLISNTKRTLVARHPIEKELVARHKTRKELVAKYSTQEGLVAKHLV